MRAAPILVVFVLALAGCAGGGGGGSVSVESGNDLVLAFEDVGAPFTQFDRGEQVNTDMSPPRDNPTRFGREGGWKARYHRPGSARTNGPVVIESRADLFESASGAGDDFELYKDALDELAEGAGGKAVDPPAELGDEAYAVTFKQGFAPNAVRYFAIAWREDNVTASIYANGFDGKTSFADAVGLSRKQQSRIARAAAS